MAEEFVQFASRSENPHYEGVVDIDPQELKDKLQNVKLIDVRQPEEYTGELGHIPGAELIVLNTLPERLTEIPKDQTVVFVCLGGGRSAQATAFARHHGFEHVYNMTGGMRLWNQLNFPVQR